MVRYISYAEPGRMFAPTPYQRFAAGCGAVAYAVAALVLRLVLARAVFLFGQAKIVGPHIPLSSIGLDYTVILPAQVPDEVLSAVAAQFPHEPVSPVVIAYGFAYAEFLLPICLAIGFGTRIAAFLLLVMTVALQIYVEPDALWTTHAYWAALALVLIARGGGAIALDRLIRYLDRY